MGTERRELLPKLAQVKEGDNANFRIRDWSSRETARTL